MGTNVSKIYRCNLIYNTFFLESIVIEGHIDGSMDLFTVVAQTLYRELHNLGSDVPEHLLSQLGISDVINYLVHWVLFNITMSGDEISGNRDIRKDAEPGFCSATCVDRACLQNEIKKAYVKTSDVYVTCNLPKKFEHPHWFNGYGCQKSKQHPLYRTSSSEYGWFPPGIHSVPSVYFPAGQRFTNHLAAAGMYRNYSLNTGMDPVGYP